MHPKLKPIGRQAMVVTGASSGIGLVTARAAARAGAQVMLVARGAEALAAAVDALTAEGHAAAWHAADVGDADAMTAAAAATVARFGRIDTWVNNAGVAIYARLVDTPADEHERLFRTNYFGMVNGTLAAIPHLRRQGGALINMGSISAELPSPILSAYAASKFAVKGYTDALRIELAEAGEPISVTLIKPSGIATPLAEHAAVHAEGEPQLPAPTYDPALVADAVIEAATHVRPEITVGGVGRALVLARAHAPRLSDLVSTLVPKMLLDPRKRPHRDSNLFAPGPGGAERAHRQSGRRWSAVQMLRGRAGMAFGLVTAGGIVALAVRRGGRG